MRAIHGVTVVPHFNWTSFGPTNIGGRTRAILIDNTDPTHQTIFAGGVTGGIWKSTNGGGTWDNASNAVSSSLDDTLSNINVCCIAQDSKGAIYIGTGEGLYQMGGIQPEFSSGELGGGIFKSTDDGKTWRLLPSTVPTADQDNVNWSYVNRIAIRPDSLQVIYAATTTGLMVSHDSGTTWNYAVKAVSLTPMKQYSPDVKISNDGSVVIVCSGTNGYYCYPKTGNSNVFTQIKSTGAGRLFGNAERIEFAISPTDPNRIYASVIATGGQFASNPASGIFMTMTALTNGGYWYEIGPGGSFAFDPYMSAFDQCLYDNTLGVPPANEAQVLVGGATLWEWSGNNMSDTLGSWEKVSHYNPFYEGDPLWVHADEHAIVFDVNNPETVYIGCDGGLFKCSNMSINPATPTLSIAALNIEQINRNYNVTQYYSICFSPEVDYISVPISINGSNTNVVEGLGVGGGTQDNGSPWVNGTAFAHYPNDAVDLSGGDGAGCVVSQLDPNIAYFCSDYGTFEREGNLGALSTPTSAYTQSVGDCEGGDIDSMWSVANTPEGSNVSFVFPMALYENSYDLLNHDSVDFIATKSYVAGDTVWPYSVNANLTYPYKLPVNLASGDTLLVPDRVVSRLAIGFSGAVGGIWITGQAASNGTVVWMPIAGTQSQPTPFSDGSPVHALAWTMDGNTLFAGCEDGGIYRFTNINSIIANKYCSGALWYNEGGVIHNTGNTNVPCANIASGLLTNRDILSISTDPKNLNNMLVTVGNYGSTDFVYYCSNDTATVGGPTLTSVQGNLPKMPVYSCVLDILDSNGNSVGAPNVSAMVGTEHGIYVTSRLNGAATVWIKDNGGMANVMTLALKQQTTAAWMCNNASTIYAGTHGRGLWASTTELKLKPTAVPNIPAPAALNDLLVYPNPMTNQGNIQFNLATADNVTITIYDMQGNAVKIINMGDQSEGRHLVSFESGGLSMGTYFATITGSNFRKVSKFVVVK